MADENKESVDVSEFDAKPSPVSGNKDLWLFLIIVDVVFLCVFGFFLYKNLSVRLLSPAEPAKSAAAPSVSELQPAAEETVLAETPAPQPVAVPVRSEEPKAEKPAVPAVAPEAEQPKQEVPAPAEDKKESVLVKVNPKSKYRQVTFRYFGEGEKVAVVSGFTMAKPRAMTKKKGVWETTLSISPGTYKYLFIVDGKQTPDPYAEQKDGRSVLDLQ